MSGIFASMNTATKGLMASQTALHTTGHNISNVNTPGYTRQRVDMKADRAFSYTGVGQLGTGVKMEAVVRMIDNHVSKQIRTENSTLNRFTEKSDALEQLELIFNEPSDTGLNVMLGKMFNAFDELAKNPESLNSKTVTVESLKTLTERLNHMGNQIERLENETHEVTEKNVLDFNSKVDQLSTLNKQIFNISIKGQTPNDLLDQRDILLKDISSIAEVDVELDKYGRASVTMGHGDDKQNILSKEGKQEYIGYDKSSKTINRANKGGKFIDEKGNVLKVTKDGLVSYEDYTIDVDTEGIAKLAKREISNGKLAGNMDALVDIREAEANLDKTATILAQAINHVHVNGNTDPNVKNDPIFTFKGYDKTNSDPTEDGKIGKEITAKNIRINEDMVEDPGKLQAGRVNNADKDEDDKFPDGDGSLALEIANLSGKKIGSKEVAGKWEIMLDDDKKEIVEGSNGNTISGNYIDVVIKIGISKEHSDNMIDNQIALTNQLEMRRESVSGVSLNDEITDVIKFQKVYEANAKVLATLTEMLDVLINRTGV